MIHVCFVLHDKKGLYSKFTGTAMCSIFENSSTPPRYITIHILHNNTLTTENRDKFISLAEKYNRLVKFYNVEELCANKIEEYVKLVPSVKDSKVSVGAFYKLLIPRILPANVNECIYLDSDIIVNLDIKELLRFQIELNDRPLGAVTEISNGVNIATYAKSIRDGFLTIDDYFNSGVLLMNLKVLRNREEDILNGFKFRGEHPEYIFFDQDILNYLFQKETLKLPVKFNRLVKTLRYDNRFVRRDVVIKVKREIYHYAGDIYGLDFDIKDPLNQLWFNYFTKTPWFSAETINNLYKGIDEFGNARRNLLIKFSAAISGKKRVFVIDNENDIDWIKKTYSVRDDEEIFIYNYDEGTLQKLIGQMHTSRDKKIFFIRVDRKLIKTLDKAGLVEGKNFFDHYDLFSSKLFTLRDAYSLIWKM